MSYNTYNNNQQQNTSKTPDMSVYSGYRMNNAESEIDATCLTFRYWKNSLCISINPKKNTNNGEVAFDMDNGITIYLSHTKARILKNEINLFLQDPVSYNGVGVPSGQSVVTISNGSEYGKNNPVLTIRKLGEGGIVVSSFAYEFKRNYHYSIRNYIGSSDFDSVYDDYQNIEIEQMVTVLDEYIKAATNAIAFTVMDQRKYSASRVENTINSIASALNVEVKSNSSSGKRFNSSSYFNNSSSETSNVSYGAATMDDLD